MVLVAGGARAASTITVGSLNLTYCNSEYNGYCGTITVPLDRNGVYPGTLTVGFEFYPHNRADEPSSGLILAQEGGPGYSTTGSRDGYLRMLGPLRATRDILLMDKRGTGLSSVIDCPALQAAYLPTRKDVAGCGRRLGSSAWFYKSSDAADDLAQLMGALGYSEADYYGDSYGTWFGQVFAVLHPALVRSMVLDSAYPTIGDPSNSEVNSGQHALDISCRRSGPCRALGSSATARFAALLSALRAAPVSGTAPGSAGEPLQVTADPAGLFLIIANAGNTPATWRDLDAAGRAWLQNQDALPLLRLVAEARDSYSGGGPAESFSVGLADAVECSEYGAPFNQRASIAERDIQYQKFVTGFLGATTAFYPPFENKDALYSQMNAEGYNDCLTWPKPAKGVVPGQSFPPNSVFPNIPVLVLSGELDTVTSPKEGADTAKLFPNAKFIETPNMVHESAIGDAGYFVPPYGEDLAECVGPIVRRFIETAGSTDDTSCLATIRPIRTVPAFEVKYAYTAPATPLVGNAVKPEGLVLAAAVSQTVGDVVARYYVTTTGQEAGLRGGSFSLAAMKTGYQMTMKKVRWAADLPVSGTVVWNQVTGGITAQASFRADGHSGEVDIAWNDHETEAQATLTGTIDGATLAATMLAP
jgi:pimeloyl-ACP methyl ester carboxylesterase